MLLDDFYRIEEWLASGAVLLLNADHPIFAGHFPGQPVVPGACQLQIVQELLSHLLGGEYHLVKADQIKFLTPIDPRSHPRIEATLRHLPLASAGAGSREAATGAMEAATSGMEAATSDREVATGGNPLQVTASLSAGETIFLKLSGIFRAG